jgi:hypothetical protein
MSTVAPPLAVGTVGIIVIVAVVLVLAAAASTLLVRNNPRQAAIDAEQERVSEEYPLGERVDFQSELRPPPEP